MADPQVVDGGEGIQMWSVAANILNKQLQRGGPQAWGLGGELTTPYYENQHVTKCYTGPWTWTVSLE
jgi:hypothetical protein